LAVFIKEESGFLFVEVRKEPREGDFGGMYFEEARVNFD
jgi:hypothetical protein